MICLAAKTGASAIKSAGSTMCIIFFILPPAFDCIIRAALFLTLLFFRKNIYVFSPHKKLFNNGTLILF
jgi:hypothetical protein